MLSNMVNAVMNEENVFSEQLVNRFLKGVAVDLMDTKYDIVEECRILWKTYKNINLWFEIWLVNLK